MSLTIEDINKITHLARLTFEENEAHALNHDLDNILKLILRMDEEDTSNVAPLAHPLDMTQPLRPDCITEINQRELFLQNAPQSILGLYLVPKVMETEG